MSSRSPSSRAGLQIVLSLGSGFIVLLLLVGARNKKLKEMDVVPPEALVIGIEQTSRSDLSITASRDATPGLLQIRSNGSGAVKLVLPVNADLREVRGMSLNAVQKESPNLGYRKWILPSGVTFSYTMPSSPSSLSVQTPNEPPILVRSRSIELKTGNVEDNTTLLQKGEAKIW